MVTLSKLSLCSLPVTTVSLKGACAHNLAPQISDLLPRGCIPSYPGSGGQWGFHAWVQQAMKTSKKVVNRGNWQECLFTSISRKNLYLHMLKTDTSKSNFESVWPRHWQRTSSFPGTVTRLRIPSTTSGNIFTVSSLTGLVSPNIMLDKLSLLLSKSNPAFV